MAKDLISSANFQSKKTFTLPKGATIISEDHTLYVEEIENGYLIRKEYSVRWMPKDGDDTQYEYYTKKWWSKDNPIDIKMPEEKSLAEKLD